MAYEYYYTCKPPYTTTSDCCYTFLNNNFVEGNLYKTFEEPYFQSKEGHLKRYLTSEEKEKFKDWRGNVLINNKVFELIWPNRDNVPFLNN